MWRLKIDKWAEIKFKNLLDWGTEARNKSLPLLQQSNIGVLFSTTENFILQDIVALAFSYFKYSNENCAIHITNVPYCY